MKFTSTRDETVRLTAAEVIAKGLSADGGLFVPTEFPQLTADDYLGKDYEEIAAVVLSRFLEGFDGLADKISKAYKGALPVTMHHLSADRTVLELFHGKSAAFKDVALQLLPYLMTESLRLTGEARRAVVLTATSGDTGSAAMSGFANIAGTEVFVFYPADGISDAQRLQMTTQSAHNVRAIAVRGNFDDAQRAVKEVFQDTAFAKEFTADSFFTSANSINFGRLVPQIVYYFWTYSELVADGKIMSGDTVNFSVPTGNFGDILAGYYAKRMGLPVGKLICATNKNAVLAEVLTTGVYDRNRDFYVTNSPSMDILVSSNFERLIYHLAGSETVRETQAALAKDGRYTLSADLLSKLQEIFAVATLDDAATTNEISKVYADEHYILDPHTAVAFGAMEKIAASGYNVVLATASPYKFPETVEAAIHEKLPADGVPESLSGLTERPVTQKKVVDADALRAVIRELLR